jgi:hypothetical protein
MSKKYASMKKVGAPEQVEPDVLETEAKTEVSTLATATIEVARSGSTGATGASWTSRVPKTGAAVSGKSYRYWSPDQKADVGPKSLGEFLKDFFGKRGEE